MAMEEMQERAEQQQKIRRQTERMTAMLAQNIEPGDDKKRNGDQRQNTPAGHSDTPRNRSALAITLTDDKAIAAAASTGDSKSPNAGYKIPAATGTPAAL
jgi:hypothetical protein